MGRMICSLGTTIRGKPTEFHAFFVHVSGQKTSALMSLSVYTPRLWTSLLSNVFCAKADFTAMVNTEYYTEMSINYQPKSARI